MVYLVPRRVWSERIFSGQHGTANYNAKKNEITPVRMTADLVTQLSETAQYCQPNDQSIST